MPQPPKIGSALIFEGGQLGIKISGHGPSDGWATFWFPEDQVLVEEGGYSIDIPPAELAAIRDFLNHAINK
jgi:hypothetical protein